MRFSNLAAMMAIATAQLQKTYGAHLPAHVERSWHRTAMRRHAKHYGTGKPMVKETANCQAAQRRLHHIAEGRYTSNQILRVA